MDAKLVVVGGNATPVEIKLTLPVTIGRGRQATLVLSHPLISRRHCEIFESNGQLVVRDLNSLNGTLINNQRIDQAVLPPGELLTLGSVTFRAVYVPEKSVKQTTAELTPTPPVTNAADGGDDASRGDERRTHEMLDSSAVGQEGTADKAEASTEVADVDPEEFIDGIREAEQEG